MDILSSRERRHRGGCSSARGEDSSWYAICYPVVAGFIPALVVRTKLQSCKDP